MPSRAALIGLANWTPDSFVGQLFKLIGRYVPPPAGVSSPALWGTEARLDELFGASAKRIRVDAARVHVPLSLAMHWIEVFRTYYGPLTKAFGALDSEKQGALTADLLELIESRNRAERPRPRPAERVPRGGDRSAVNAIRRD